MTPMAIGSPGASVFINNKTTGAKSTYETDYEVIMRSGDASLRQADGTMPEHHSWESLGRCFPDRSAGNPAPGVPFSPCDCGYTVEVRVNGCDDVEVEKHYAMGRFAVEAPFVAPDNRTVYMSDDGTNVAFLGVLVSRAARSLRPPPPQNRTCGTIASYVVHHIRCVMWRCPLCGAEALTGGSR